VASTEDSPRGTRRAPRIAATAPATPAAHRRCTAGCQRACFVNRLMEAVCGLVISPLTDWAECGTDALACARAAEGGILRPPPRSRRLIPCRTSQCTRPIAGGDLNSQPAVPPSLDTTRPLARCQEVSGKTRTRESPGGAGADAAGGLPAAGDRDHRPPSAWRPLRDEAMVSSEARSDLSRHARTRAAPERGRASFRQLTSWTRHSKNRRGHPPLPGGHRMTRETIG